MRFRPKLTVILAACVLAAAATGLAAASASSQGRVAEARAHEQSLGAQIGAVSEQIDAVEAEAANLGGQVASLEARLESAQGRLRALEQQLGAKTHDLRSVTQQLSLARERAARRLVEIYTSDQLELPEILVGAGSLDELVDGIETRSRVVELDDRLATEISDLRVRTVRERARIAQLRRRQQDQTRRIAVATERRRAAYLRLVARRDHLVSLRNSRRRSLASLTVRREQWEREAAALSAQSAAVSTASSGNAVVGSGSGTGFLWPVRGSVVSPFGMRWGKLHAGLDIAAPAGTAIVASSSGQVAYAGSMSGYGLIVVIQHGGGVATAYAHNSSIVVSVGQSVSQGQTIAAVGCTGHCFGDHVHFEVRVNGTPVDPMGYL